MYLLVNGFEPTSSVFLGECATHQATVAGEKYEIAEEHFHFEAKILGV